MKKILEAGQKRTGSATLYVYVPTVPTYDSSSKFVGDFSQQTKAEKQAVVISSRNNFSCNFVFGVYILHLTSPCTCKLISLEGENIAFSQ